MFDPTCLGTEKKRIKYMIETGTGLEGKKLDPKKEEGKKRVREGRQLNVLRIKKEKQIRDPADKKKKKKERSRRMACR